MTFTSIDPIPTGLRSQQQAVFDAAMAGFMQQLPTTVTQMNTAGSQTDVNAAAATTGANSATAQALIATSAAAVATSASGALMFNSGTSYTQGQAAISLVNFQTYRRKTAGASATDPANDPTNWNIGNQTLQIYTPRTSNIQLVQSDSGRLIDVTSGSFTQTLAAGISLGIGWYVDYRNSGTGDVLIDPNTSEQIAGALTFSPTKSGQSTYRISWDGSAFQVVILSAISGYIKVSDQKASGTQGGTATTTNITAVRTLNTVEANTIAGASLAANTVTLPAGTYRVRASAPFCSTGTSKIFLYNNTDSTYTVIGDSLLTPGTATLYGQFTITAQKDFRIRYYVGTTSGTNDLGANVNSGQVEVYAQAEFTKAA
jgi:hypothetical protein